MAKDRLDGTKKGPFLWELYNAPGRLILWLGYMFPAKGYANVRKGARHARSPWMTFFTATGFWIWSFFWGYVLFVQETAPPAEAASKIESAK